MTSSEFPNIPGYQFLEKLGEGGMGSVFKARQISLDRMVAVKILSEKFGKDKAYIEEFKQEARHLAHLKHHNIVQTYEAGEIDGRHYFIMEYISGYTVGAWLRRKGKLTETNALLIAESVSDALAYAWESVGTFHGDLKPDNIMVDGDGTIKVGDFMAVSYQGAQSSFSFSDVILGTPNYMSPEQAEGLENVDFRSDIFSLGLLLYHLVTGVLPFGDIKDDDILETLRNNILEDPAALNKELSPGIVLLIEKLTVRDRNQRYESWRDVLSDVEEVIAKKRLATHHSKQGLSPIGQSEHRKKTEPPELQPEKKIITVKKTDIHEKTLPTPPSDGKPKSRTLQIISILVVALILGALFLFIKGQDFFKSLDPKGIDRLSGLTKTPSKLEPSVSPEPRKDLVPYQAPRIVPGERNKPEELPPGLEQGEHEKQDLAAGTTPPITAPKGSLQREPDTNTHVPDQPTVQEEDQPLDLVEYANLVQRIVRLTKRREFPFAEKTADAWLRDHPDHTLRPRVERDREKIKEMAGLFNLLVQNRKRLIGTKIKVGRNSDGTIQKISRDQITVVRQIQNGEAEFMFELLKLTSTSFTTLLKQADPDQYAKHLSLYRVSRGQFSSARKEIMKTGESGEASSMVALIEDWEQAGKVYMLLKGVTEAEQAISDQQKKQAIKIITNLEIQYGELDIPSVVGAERWNKLQETTQEFVEIGKYDDAFAVDDEWFIDEGVAGDASAEKEDVWDIFAGELDDTQDEGRETVQPKGPSPSTGGLIGQKLKAIRVTPQELNRGFLEFDKKFISLVFRWRGRINQLEENLFETHLGDRDGHVRVVYTREGSDWIKKIPRSNHLRSNYYYGKAPKKKVFGNVSRRSRTITLIGRKVKIHAGPGGHDYTW